MENNENLQQETISPSVVSDSMDVPQVTVNAVVTEPLTVVVQSGDNVTVKLDESQYNGIIEAIDGVKNQVASSGNKVSHTVSDSSANIVSLSGAFVPDGYYETSIDLQSQLTFFVSLVCGMLLCILFVKSFK